MNWWLIARGAAGGAVGGAICLLAIWARKRSEQANTRKAIREFRDRYDTQPYD